MQSNFSNIAKSFLGDESGSRFFNLPVVSDNSITCPWDISQKKHSDQIVKMTYLIQSLLDNVVVPSLLLQKLSRLVALVKDTSVFEMPKFVFDVDNEENELKILISHRVLDDCCISLYYDDIDENDYEVFLSYCSNGKYKIKSGTVNAIAHQINLICEKGY